MYKCSISQKICVKDHCEMFGERWRECGYKIETVSTRGYYKRTDAHREMWRKIGLTNRGKTWIQKRKDHRSQTFKGRPGYNKGRSHTEDELEKMRISQRARRKREKREMKQ